MFGHKIIQTQGHTKGKDSKNSYVQYSYKYVLIILKETIDRKKQKFL